MEIYAANISQCIDSLDIEKLLDFLDIERKRKLSKLKNINDIKRSLLGDLLIRKIISKVYNKENDQIIFLYNDFGKPYVDGIPDFHFNISHSGEWVVCAIDNLPIGIDIEYIQPIDLSFAMSFFSNEESKVFGKLEGDNKVKYFYDYWTLKESYIKALGKGIDYLLELSNKNLFNTKINNLINRHFFRRYSIDINYSITVCALNDNFPNINLIYSLDRINEG